MNVDGPDGFHQAPASSSAYGCVWRYTPLPTLAEQAMYNLAMLEEHSLPTFVPWYWINLQLWMTDYACMQRGRSK